MYHMHLKLPRNLYRPARGCKQSYGLVRFFAVFVMVVSCLGALFVAGSTRVHAETKSDAEFLVEGLRHIDQGQWSRGRAQLARSNDPLAAKLYLWLVFSRDMKRDQHNYTFVKLAQFIRHNPDWPGMYALRKRAEEDMPDNLRMADVIRWFDDYPPLTAGGMDKYLQALLLSGQKENVRTKLRDWWGSTTLARGDQRALYQKYASFLGHEAHVRRLDFLLFRRQFTNARAIAEVLGGGYPALTEARIALAARQNGVDNLIAKVPSQLQSDAGLMYERLRWRRREDKDFDAMEILHKPPPVDEITNPEDWWQERHILIRRMLEESRFKSAYLLASDHIQRSGFAFAQAEWLAGWLALRFMDKPAEAFKRFDNLYRKVETPISKARAAYWAGRAAKAYGQPQVAAGWFKAAARYQTTFYGQTAADEMAMLGQLPSTAPPLLTAKDMYDFNSNDLIRAARFLYSAGMREDVSDFLWAFVEQQDTPKAYRFAAELAGKLKHPHDAVRIAKEATKNGMFLTAQSYPLMTSRLSKLGVDVEWALVHALVRQESMFDYKAQSPAGALGLMQIMPATARAVAKSLGIGHRTEWLTTRPDHNIRLGAAYLEELLARYDGYYPMVIAAYNAGPGRVDRWIRQFGDPRRGQVDLVDWIELLSIYETRNYVQRVMESIYVYRLRLGADIQANMAVIHVNMR